MSFRGLRFKLTLTLVLIVFVFGAITGLVIPHIDATDRYDAFEDRLRFNAGSAAAMLELHPPDAWNGVLKRLLSTDGHVRWAVVTASSGDRLALQRGEGLPEALALVDPSQTVGAVHEDAFVRVIVPVRTPNDRGGILTIGYSDEAFNATEDRIFRTHVTFNLSALLLISLLGWFLGGRFTMPLRQTSDRLTQVSQDLLSAARAREASAAEEAAAVEETRRTMDMLLSSAQKIADSASAVLGNAERTFDGNREIADRIELLNRHAEKVAEILASIMQVADRTDLLALNAALEGTKAGEAGRGFTLVAKEMRRLAESVMDSVEGIRRLMRDVRTAGQGAVESSHDGTRFSEETTRSVREIALVTQQQRKATEQVSRSMDEMTELLNHAMADIKQTTRSAAELGQVSTLLARLVAKGEEKAAKGRA